MPRSRPGPGTGRPPTRTSPSVGCRNPAIRFRIVLLPQPDGPMIEMNSPRPGASSITNDTSCKAVNGPNRTETLRNSAIGGSCGVDALTNDPAGKEITLVPGAP